MRFKNILKPPHLGEGYKIMPPMDKEKYPEMPGLEGPFTMMSGKVVYYDPKEGAYYDKDADMYMSYDEFQQHDNDYGDMKDERDEVKKEADELNIGAKGDRPYKAPRQPKRGDPINPKSKGVDPKVLNMFLTNSITEGEMSDIHAMISNADNPEEMVMDLVDKGGPQGQFLYSELEQLATEAGTTFNNAESLPEDFVDELLANMGIEGYTFESDVYPPRGDMEMDPSNMRSSGAPKSSPRPKPRPMRVPRPKPRPTTRIGGMPDGSTRGIDPKDNYSPEDLKRLLMQSAMSEMEEAGNEDAQMYTPDEMINIISDTMAEADSDFIAKVGTDVLAGKCTVAEDGEMIMWDPELQEGNTDHEPGIEEGHSPHKKGTKKYKAHMAAMHANSVDLNAMRDALKLDESTDANTVVAQYTRACLDHRHNTWGKVCEQIDHVRSFVKEDVDVNNVRLQIRKMHEQEGLDRKIQIKENVDKLRQIVKDKSAMSIKFADGSMKVDMTTASIFLQVFDKVKEETQAKIIDKIQTKSGFLSVLDKMYSMIG
tara:strand:- start:78 stop:1697 length:1620 start_codon:yes stop_codon:yes gene_type:complete